MNSTKKCQLEDYKKFLLSRLTVTTQFTEFVENCLISEDEAAKHSFHKIMVHSFGDSAEELFSNLSEYLTTAFIPIQYQSHLGISSFYTNNLNVVLKILRHDFMFPHKRAMYNIDILFNDKSSVDCFRSKTTIEDIVSGIVSRRFSDKFELDLSDFCNDPEFSSKNIHFYKLSLLANFKILMIRMGRDTKLLNLSNNGLSVIPQEIINFFIKGALTAVNLSNNNIQTMANLRVISRIEQLWLEGNPLCDDEDAISYVKQLTMKFPRIKEVDGIKVNQHGVIYPFWKNFIVTNDRRTKMLVEKFLILYFTHYDSYPRNKIENFYNQNALLAVSSKFSYEEELSVPHYMVVARNWLQKGKMNNIIMNDRSKIKSFLYNLPQCTHDPKSFQVDVLHHDKNQLTVVVDGIFREKNVLDSEGPDRILQFRRTFVLEADPKINNTVYFIDHDMLTVSYATIEMAEHCFKSPIRNMNTLTLINPDKEDIDTICAIFINLTNLKRNEAEMRLKIHDWDIRKALLSFSAEMRKNKISPDKFIENDLSDLSSIEDDEID